MDGYHWALLVCFLGAAAGWYMAERRILEGDDGEVKFTAQAKAIKKLSAAMLVEHFGEQCKEFEPECECCERWAALNRLTRGWW